MYLRKNGTPYYVGKGKGDRAFRTNRRIRPPKDKSRIVFHTKDLSEDKAFALEVELIAKYGRIDNGTGILRNLTDGGEGASGLIMSDEFRAKRKEAINRPEVRAKLNEALNRPEVRAKHKEAMNRPEVRAKLSRNNGMKNPETVAKVLATRARKKAEALAAVSENNLIKFFDDVSTELDSVAEKQQS